MANSPLPAPVYTPGSFGHWSGTTFNAIFHAECPGWPHRLTPGELSPQPTIGLMAMSPKGSSQPGQVWLRIALPNDRQKPVLRIEVCVTTDRQGVHAHRLPTNDELAVLHAQWFALRDAALLDYDTPNHEFLDNAEAAAAFARVAHVFQTPSCSVRPESQGSHALLMSVKPGAVAARAVPPAPVLPSALPKAAQSPTASALQREMQQAISDAEADMRCMGNGYAWAVEMVLGHLSGVLAKHTPGFDMDDYRFNDE